MPILVHYFRSCSYASIFIGISFGKYRLRASCIAVDIHCSMRRANLIDNALIYRDLHTIPVRLYE